jgi:hypothetical protein
MNGYQILSLFEQYFHKKVEEGYNLPPDLSKFMDTVYEQLFNDYHEVYTAVVRHLRLDDWEEHDARFDS